MTTKKLESQLLTFDFNEKTITDVECNIEIEDDAQWKKIFVTSRDYRLTEIQDQPNVDVKITHSGSDGEVVKETSINKASVRGFSIVFGRVGTISFYLYPKDVYVTQRVSPATGKTKLTLNYYINKAPIISPFYRLIPNEQGEVKREAQNPLAFPLANNLNLSSEISFTYSLKGDHFESDRYQLLRLTLRKRKDSVKYIKEVITPKVNDFLMLVSLLHDSKVNFTSWRMVCDGLYIWYYKSQGMTADAIDENSLKELIDRKYLQEFIIECFPVYQSSEYKASIDNAIYTLMLDRNNVIELSFLSYFQALESMVLTYKRLSNTEFNFANNTFRKLRALIEKTIDNEIPDDRELSRKLKNKLGELNRVSLKDATQDFYSELRVDSSNIWPLFDDKPKGIIGLTTIRNVLIHGDLLPPEKLRSVAIACQHLRVLLIRCVFALLGWDHKKTKVHSEYLMTRNYLFEPSTLTEALCDIHSYFVAK